MRAGTQVLYLPPHAGDDVNHPDAEHGFIIRAGTMPALTFCRFFLKGSKTELRTTANSELVPVDRLRPMVWANQEVVRNLIVEIGGMERAHATNRA